MSLYEQLTDLWQPSLSISITIDCYQYGQYNFSSNLLEMPTNWYKMAAIMNRYCENDGIDEVWEAVCASLVPERSKLR